MNSFYSSSNGLKQVMSILIGILSIMIVFTIGAFLLKVLLYLAPVALVGWFGYKGYKAVRGYFAKKAYIKQGSAKFTNFNTSVEVVSSEVVIERAINNNKVIDVEYKEV
jgi:hypothetical protein